MKKINVKTPKTTKAPTAPGRAAAKPVQKAPAKKAAIKTTSTTITAKIDVGFGNAIYVRGDGPGLSWDKGLVMDCAADDEWTITISDAVKPVVFKLLMNDLTWCAGNDYLVEPGAKIAIKPAF
jgi:hypothetical protein